MAKSAGRHNLTGQLHNNDGQRRKGPAAGRVVTNKIARRSHLGRVAYEHVTKAMRGIRRAGSA
jgi:hypothetical protein